MAVRDVFFISVVLLITGIIFLMGNKIGNEFNDNLVAVPIINSTPGAATAINNITDKGINAMDYIFSGLFLAFLLSIIVSAFLLPTIPIFMAIYAFILIFVVFISIVIKNIWLEISSRSDFTTTLLNFPIMDFILSNLPTFITVVGLVGIFITFAKGGLGKGKV